MHHIFLEEAVDNTQGVLIGRGIEIQGAPQKMPGRIRHIELLGRGRIPADVEEDAADAISGPDRGIVDGSGLIGMLEGHFIGILLQFVEIIGPRADLLVADIDPGVEAGEIDVDPIGVLRRLLEEAGIAQDAGVYGIFEGIGKARLIEGLVLVGREIYFVIAPRPGRIGVVAAGQEQEEGKGEW